MDTRTLTTWKCGALIGVLLSLFVSLAHADVRIKDIADIEGNAEAAQEALRHLPNARPDPVWRCTVCGTVHQAWHPICDACDTAGRMKWSEMDVATTAVPRQLPPAAIEAFT